MGSHRKPDVINGGKENNLIFISSCSGRSGGEPVFENPNTLHSYPLPAPFFTP